MCGLGSRRGEHGPRAPEQLRESVDGAGSRADPEGGAGHEARGLEATAAELLYRGLGVAPGLQVEAEHHAESVRPAAHRRALLTRHDEDFAGAPVVVLTHGEVVAHAPDNHLGGDRRVHEPRVLPLAAGERGRLLPSSGAGGKPTH